MFRAITKNIAKCCNVCVRLIMHIHGLLLVQMPWAVKHISETILKICQHLDMK